MKEFEEYLASIAVPEQRRRVEDVLHWVAAEFPGLVPRYAWNQPMFTDHGTFIIGFSVAKPHMAVAPEKAGIDRFSDAIAAAGYEHSRYLYRMPWNAEVNYGLLKDIIEFNIADKAGHTLFWRKNAKATDK